MLSVNFLKFLNQAINFALLLLVIIFGIMSENKDKSNLENAENGLSENITIPPQSKSSKKRNKSKKHQENHKVENNIEENGTQEEVKINKKESNKMKKEVKAEDLKSLAGNENTISIKDLKAAMEALTMAQKPAKTTEEAMTKQFQFWKTQPVPQLDEEVTVSEAIEPDKDPSEIRKEPYTLPDGFKWDTLNLQDPLVLKELYNLLNENYVEDDDAMFRFDYQPEFLQWALQPPGWKKEWLCGVRVVKSGRLVGFISAVPATLHIKESSKPMVEINFLCVHKKLRSKRVAPVLIREITRRVHLQGLFQAVYTAGIILPKPVTSCRYWHRSLNPKKLIDVKFSHLSRNMTLQRTLKLYKLPEAPRTPGFRKMTKKDLVPAHKLLSEYLRKFSLAPEFSLEEFTHFFLPRPNIVDSFVVEREGKITDFVSYYTLPSTIMHHAIHKFLKAAYSFYNVSTVTPWVELMNDALISAKSLGFDVFNALDLMDNKEFLEPLKFGIGDGNLQYYLYNWKCPNLKPQELGLVLH